jgi:M6 family metalloprotease-like protein
MRKQLALLAALLFLGTFLTSTGQAATKSGASCPKSGATATSASKKFTCIKSGKKLIWDGGVTISTPATAPSTSPAPLLSADSDFASASDCKLTKPSNLPMDDGPMGSVGMPASPNEFASTGNLKGLVILTDFSDVPASSEMKDVWVNSSIPSALNLFNFSSYGKLNLKIDLSTKVYRMAKPSTYYSLTADPSGGPVAGAPTPKLDEVIVDAMKLADADYDFNQYSFVAVGAPRSSSLILSGATGLGRILTPFDGKTFTQGDFVPLDANTPLNKPYKVMTFAHDIGHMLGLMHPYVDRSGTHGAWDVMWPFAYQNDLLGWNKWKLNWITDDQVSCTPMGSAAGFTQLLTPIGDPSSGKKLAVIKLSSTEALTVEVRRKSPLDTLKSTDEGVIVYKVDSTKASGLGAYTIVSNPTKSLNFQNFEATLGTMKAGESISNSGYTITVLQSAAKGDYVSIKKTK